MPFGGQAIPWSANYERAKCRLTGKPCYGRVIMIILYIILRECSYMQAPKQRVHASNGHRVEWMHHRVTPMLENVHHV